MKLHEMESCLRTLRNCGLSAEDQAALDSALALIAQVCVSTDLPADATVSLAVAKVAANGMGGFGGFSFSHSAIGVSN